MAAFHAHVVLYFGNSCIGETLHGFNLLTSDDNVKVVIRKVLLDLLDELNKPHMTIQENEGSCMGPSSLFVVVLL